MIEPECTETEMLTTHFSSKLIRVIPSRAESGIVAQQDV